MLVKNVMIHLVVAFPILFHALYLQMHVNGITHVRYNFHAIPFIYQEAKPIMYMTYKGLFQGRSIMEYDLHSLYNS
jgi:hypothetical protein